VAASTARIAPTSSASFSDDIVGWHTAKLGDRWALEPMRQGVRHTFGRFGKDVARGLRIVVQTVSRETGPI
jgi:hypothetical protein